jgi:hypothetical protein
VLRANKPLTTPTTPPTAAVANAMCFDANTLDIEVLASHNILQQSD